MPKEVRRHVSDPTSDFQHLLIEYLENAHVGEFLTGIKEDILKNLLVKQAKSGYVDSCDRLPTLPPEACKAMCKSSGCALCGNVMTWWSTFRSTVDQILALSNIHTCFSTAEKDGSQNKQHPFLGCLDNI